MPFRPRLANDIQARHFRQSEIDDGQVDRVFEREIEPFPAVARLLDTKTGIGKLFAKGFPQGEIVFND